MACILYVRKMMLTVGSYWILTLGCKKHPHWLIAITNRRKKVQVFNFLRQFRTSKDILQSHILEQIISRISTELYDYNWAKNLIAQLAPLGVSNVDIHGLNPATPNYQIIYVCVCVALMSHQHKINYFQI